MTFQGGKKNLSVAARLDEQLVTGVVVETVVPGAGAEHEALTNLARGYRVDMCTESRRRLAAIAAHEVARADFDSNRVQMTKHITKVRHYMYSSKGACFCSLWKGIME